MSTTAYSVDWEVIIQPEGDVSADVSEITISREAESASATVVLDTSESPHALEEQEDIHIEISDQNATVTFDGFTDSVKDDADRPIVTIDARTPSGVLKDTTIAGSISGDDLWDVIDKHLDNGPGRVREITFDAAAARNRYGTFSRDINFGEISVSHSGIFDQDTESFSDEDAVSEGTDAELVFDSYYNDVTTYTMDIEGKDGAGNTVTASLDLPPAETAEEAFGSDHVKLALSGGNQRWADVTGFTTDIPSDLKNTYQGVLFTANIFNYVKLDWRWPIQQNESVQYAINSVVSYISGLDQNRDWESFVDNPNDELIVQPAQSESSDRHIFREGTNVMKPVANRDLDGVRNFIKVVGANDLNGWFWAYNGDLRYALENPFESGEFPDGGVLFGSSPAGGQNDIDQINLRGESLESRSFTSIFQILEMGKKGLRQFIRTPVTGTAPVPGIMNVEPGDEAEVYYPSRGIPQKVESNIYTVEKVEFDVQPNSAKTSVDFGTPRPNTADVISAGGGILRQDIDSDIRQYSSSISKSGSSESQGTDPFPVVGELIEKNSDGTWDIRADNGELYENVRVI